MTDKTIYQGQHRPELSAADKHLLHELTERVRTGQLKLTGEGGLLGKLTEMVIEHALEGVSPARPSRPFHNHLPAHHTRPSGVTATPRR
jgi:hypothetical protein